MVQRTVYWTLRSQKDKIKIYKYWNNHNKSTVYAKKLEIEFEQRMNLVARFPLIGRKTKYSNLRYIELRTFHLYYTVKKESIDVLFIWSTHQNSDTLEIKK